MSNLISEITPVWGMMANGFVVSVMTEKEGLVTYGVFDSKESAHDWAKNLEGAVSIAPVYRPAWNRG